MFIKFHADECDIAVNTDKIAAIQPIIVDNICKTQICFGDDFVNVDESFDEVFSAITEMLTFHF